METATETVPDKQLLSANDLAAYLGVSKTTAYLLMYDRAIPSLKIRGSRRVRKQDVDAYIQEQLDAR